MELDTAILAALERHTITRLIHFTPLVNLLGMLDCHAIMPMDRVRAYAAAHPESDLLDYIQRNDRLRLDRRTDCINLSLQRTNAGLFRRFRTNLCNLMGVQDLAWCVLELDPTLCAHPGVNFTTTLAAELLTHDGFTDLAFNPTRSFNSQAYAAAFYASLHAFGCLTEALADAPRFFRLHSHEPLTHPKCNIPPRPRSQHVQGEFNF